MSNANRAPNLVPVTLVLTVVFWLFTMTGGGDIFVKEVLGGAYDSQAEHFMRGDVGVDSDAIAHEMMIVNGKVRMYFGPFPAFLRIPLNFIYPGGHGKWSRISGFCAGVIALCAFAGLVQTVLRSSQLSSRARNWIGNFCVIGFALGSPLLLLLGNLSIYDEAIIWALAWSMAALYFAWQSRTAEGSPLTRSLLAFSFCAGAALLSRGTFGIPYVLIAPLLAIRLLQRPPMRNIPALFLPLGAALVFYLFLSYARFGDFSGMNMKYNINPVQRDFAVKHGLFRVERVPYSFADYFFLRTPRLQHQAPFLKASRQDYQHDTLYVMPFTETYSSLLWSSSWLLLGAVIGVAILLRPGGADAVDRGIAAIFLLQVIGVLAFMGLCQRYIADFFPFLVFAFLIFLRQGKMTFQLRYLLSGLVIVSVVINSLSTVSWLLEADLNVPAATRAKWNRFLGRPS
ncbi:MAG TPA: hypothetical protein VFX07_08940 [Candidatus Udaeobacter sp.]|jgi:hypothetical protein|nr:hypothetical protein [Candidatus Udaeobacter sp.]